MGGLLVYYGLDLLVATGLPWIFVSHYREDHEGKAFLSTLISNHQKFRLHWYSIEKKALPHAKSIRDKIRESAALFVMLSKEMQTNGFTRSWVGYEVGIAEERNIPIVVIECAECKPVEVPVPGATAYLARTHRLKSSDTPPWSKLADTAAIPEPTPEQKSTGSIWIDLLAALAQGFQQIYDPTFLSQTTCSNAECKAPFACYPTVFYTQIPCPVCRTRTGNPAMTILQAIHADDVA